MKFAHITRTVGLFALGSVAAACTGETVSTPSTPEIQSRELAQLSAGGGIAGYDFYEMVNGVRGDKIGTVLVTNGGHGGNYADQTEYWRWDADSLDDIEAGDVDDIDVEHFADAASYSAGVAAGIISNFETGTSAWTNWTVNREFDLDGTASFEWNNLPDGEILYTMEAAAWEGAGVSTISYFLKMDFHLDNDAEDIAWRAANPGYPEMIWYVDFLDYLLWQDSQADDNIYEVQLQDYSDMSQATSGAGHELKTM